MNEISFVCEQCGVKVSALGVGTAHRNHCPFCLWSKHLDSLLPGDRAGSCGGMMKPAGLTFKNKQGGIGELMVAHKCMICGEIKKNRIAGDDRVEKIECLFKECLELGAEEMKEMARLGIRILGAEDEGEVLSQLYGKTEAERRMTVK